MNYKLFISAFLSLLFICTSKANPITVTGDGGQSYYSMDRSKFYVEDSVFYFNIELEYDTLNQLYQRFKDLKKSGSPLRKKLKGYRFAGFCFVPIKNMTLYPKSSSAEPDTLRFYSEGFYAIPTLWKGLDALPDEVVFFFEDSIYTIGRGIDSLESYFLSGIKPKHVVTISPTSSQVKTCIATKYDDPADILFETREFDVVFMDRLDFDRQGTSTKYYTGSVRSDEGITIERSYTTMEPEGTSGGISTLHYRSLITKPWPNPTLAATYDSKAAIAYEKHPECPPWWREPPTISESVMHMVAQGNTFISTRTEFLTAERVTPPYPWSESWFRWLMSILVAIFLIQWIRVSNKKNTSDLTSGN